jgi:hypothetical protein
VTALQRSKVLKKNKNKKVLSTSLINTSSLNQDDLETSRTRRDGKMEHSVERQMKELVCQIAQKRGSEE